MGVTEQEAAISAMVNWRESYIRWALPISAGVILGVRPAVASAGASGGQPGVGAFPDQGGFVFGHEGEHAEYQGAVGGGGVDEPVAQ